jgi:hypothetical protein
MSKALLAFLLLFLAGTATAQPLDPAKLSQIDAAIDTAIGEGRLPGAVVWVERGSNIYWKAYGKRSLIPTEETMTTDTIFDAASLTKVLATAPAIIRRRQGSNHRAPIAHAHLRLAGRHQHQAEMGRNGNGHPHGLRGQSPGAARNGISLQ